MDVTCVKTNNKRRITIKALEKEVMTHECRMLKNNELKTLLPVSFRFVDEWLCMEYEADGEKSLSEIYKDRHFSENELYELIDSLYAAQEELREYFLSEDGLLLDPEYIFVSEKALVKRFCYVLGRRAGVSENARPLLHFLLDHVDYTDQKAVTIAYGLFQNKNDAPELITAYKLYADKERSRSAIRYDTEDEDRLPDRCAEEQTGLKGFFYSLLHRRSKKQLLTGDVEN